MSQPTQETDGGSTATVDQLILDHLATAELPEQAEDLLLAAMLGPAELDAAIGGHRPARPAPAVDPREEEPAGAYLTAIEVQGFRGIGQAARLDLVPGPGLTVVVGRNGSGKSSFAEAAELALTGANRRWTGQAQVWRDGWRNLHVTGERYVRVGLGLDGHRGGGVVECRWSESADLDQATRFMQCAGQPRQPVADLGWQRPMELYRPFLSYQDLSSMLSGKPSEFYDSLHRVLGLGRLTDIEHLLKDVRRDSDQTRKRAREELPALREALATHSDPRARDAETLLSAREVDLAALEQLATDAAPAGDQEGEALRALSVLVLPNRGQVADAVQRLRSAAQQIADLATTPAAEAQALAELLRAALQHQQTHPDQPCPVCAGRLLDSDWAADAQTQITQLTTRAAGLDEAYEQLRGSREALRELSSTPAVLDTDPPPVGIDLTATRAAWRDWNELLRADDPDRTAAEALGRFDALAAAVASVRSAADQALADRHHAWQPVAEQLRGWISTCHQSRRATATYKAAAKAVAWLVQTGTDIRNDRLKPLALQSTELWNLLRQDSNVDLGAVELASSGPRRHVKLDVAVDGEPGAALGVMSQGELHALALSLFLPRATMSASPFRFLIIDDPVQSMDPSKVCGLAQVLQRVAQRRQVIVFTHDDRLPAAIRRLGIAAHLRVVDRAERAQLTVTVPANADPAPRYLDDARAVANDGKLDGPLRTKAVCVYVRDAIEAKCHDLVFAAGIRAGLTHREIDDQLAEPGRVREALCLALFGDPDQEDRLEPRLGSVQPRAPRLLREVNAGAHGRAITGDLHELVRDAEALIVALGRLQ